MLSTSPILYFFHIASLSVSGIEKWRRGAIGASDGVLLCDMGDLRGREDVFAANDIDLERSRQSDTAFVYRRRRAACRFKKRTPPTRALERPCVDISLRRKSPENR